MPIILSQMLEAYRWIGALLVLSAHSTNLFVSLHDIMTALWDDDFLASHIEA